MFFVIPVSAELPLQRTYNTLYFVEGHCPMVLLSECQIAYVDTKMQSKGVTEFK